MTEWSTVASRKRLPTSWFFQSPNKSINGNFYCNPYKFVFIYEQKCSFYLNIFFFWNQISYICRRVVSRVVFVLFETWYAILEPRKTNWNKQIKRGKAHTQIYIYIYIIYMYYVYIFKWKKGKGAFRNKVSRSIGCTINSRFYAQILENMSHFWQFFHLFPLSFLLFPFLLLFSHFF